MLQLDPHLRVSAPVRARDERLTALVYELLDAHDDTARLAAGDSVADDLRWAAHLAYLRDLQRVARGMLARDAAAS